MDIEFAMHMQPLVASILGVFVIIVLVVVAAALGTPKQSIEE